MSDSGGEPIEILVNARAGRRGSSPEPRLRGALDGAGVAVRIREVDPERLTAEVEAAVRRGAATIGVAGGDGTLAAAAASLAGSETALLPVPTGTLNNFARRLGLERPGDVTAAIAAPVRRDVPLGVMDDALFLNTATFGLYADVVRRRERLRPLLSKWPAAAIAFLCVLRRMDRIEAVIHVDGETHRRSTPLLWVGIGWGSFPRVQDAPERRRSPDLEIVALRARTRLGAMALLARLSRKLLRDRRPLDDPGLQIVHGRSMLIHASGPIGVTLDGEVLRCDPPIFVSIHDRGLKVVTRAVGGER